MTLQLNLDSMYAYIFCFNKFKLKGCKMQINRQINK